MKNLEENFVKHPSRYKNRLGLLPLMGYGYILVLLLGSIGLSYTLIRFGLAWNAIADKSDLIIRIWGPMMIIGVVGVFVIPLLYLVWTIIVALSDTSSNVPPEDPIEISLKYAQHLLTDIDMMMPSKSSGTVSRIFLIESPNAQIFHAPHPQRLHDKRYYLFVGLPLMMALSPEEFQAVLAHEIAHMFVGSSGLWRWVMLSKTRFVRVAERLRRIGVFYRFFLWYLPLLDAYMSAFSRIEEHAADRFFAHAIPPDSWTSALARIEISNIFLEEVFWPTIYQQAYSQATPPSMVYDEMGRRLRNDINKDQMKKWLMRSLLQKSCEHDSHPPFSQRLHTADILNNAPESIHETAAMHYLQESGGAYYSRQFSNRWAKAIAAQWQHIYTIAQDERQRGDELKKKVVTTPLSLEEAFHYAYLMEKFTGAQAALPLYHNVLVQEPSHAMAMFAIGRILLSHDDEQGIEYLENAMQLDSQITLDGCELLYYFLLEHGKQHEAEQYEQRAHEYIELVAKAQQERSIAGNKQYTYLEHGLSPQHIEPLIEQLSQYPKITHAYLVRLHIRYFPEKPCWVLGIVVRLPWYAYAVTYKRGLEFARQLTKQITLPGDVVVLPFEKIHGIFLKQWDAMKMIPHAAIYRKIS